MFFGREDIVEQLNSGYISPTVAADGYFDAIVPFSRLLKKI